MKAWQGKGGSKLWAVPASVPTVSTPMPMIGVDWASQRAHSGARPGVWGPVSFALRKRPASSARLDHPVRERPVLGLPGLDVLDGQQEVRVVGALPALVDDDSRRDQLAGGDLGDVDAFPARHPVDGSVEMGADVLARRDVVPVPAGPPVVVAADLFEGEVPGVGEGRRQLDHRRRLRERRRQVDHLDAACGEAVYEIP